MTPSELSRRARAIYREGSWAARSLQRYRPWICPFDRMLPLIPPNTTVLDVGCGGGLFLFLLATSEVTITGTGVDVSHASIRFAQENRNHEPSLQRRLDFQVLDATRPWPFGKFDVVSLIDVLHHVPQGSQLNVLEEAASHVKPSGVLLYKDMCDSPRWQALANRTHDLLLAQQWIHYLPIEKVEQWAMSKGMKLSHREDVRRFWYGHELRVFQQVSV